MNHESGENARAVKSYYLRDLDPELWKRVKVRALQEDRSVRSAILELLKLYATHGLDWLKNRERK